MRLRILYATRYLYSSEVTESHNEVRLMPTNDEEQTRLQFQITTAPHIKMFNYEHVNGRVHHFNLRQRHRELSLNAEAVVLTDRRTLFTDEDTPQLDPAFYRLPEVGEQYAEYIAPSRRVPILPGAETLAHQAIAASESPAPGDLLRSVMNVLHEQFEYCPGSTTVDTPLEEVLATRSGVCQDFTHLMLSACRSMAIPSRYVSGYLYTGDAEKVHDQQPQRLTQDVGDVRLSSGLAGGDATHAWVECLLPNKRWYGFDPTNNLLANDSYVKVHHGRDYDDVTPLRGVYKGTSTATLEVSVQVLRE